MKTLYASLGVLSVAMGIIGVFVPGFATHRVRDCRVVSFARSSIAAARTLARGEPLARTAAPAVPADAGHAAQEQGGRAGVDVDRPGTQHLRAR